MGKSVLVNMTSLAEEIWILVLIERSFANTGDVECIFLWQVMNTKTKSMGVNIFIDIKGATESTIISSLLHRELHLYINPD